MQSDCPKQASSDGDGFDSSAFIRLRVLAASTGSCYPITLHPNELRYVNRESRHEITL